VSGLHAERDGLVRLFTLRFRCPACEDLHEWQVSEGRVHIRQETVPLAYECQFVPTSEISAEILRDLGMSDPEIDAYLRRFTTGALEPLRLSDEGTQYSFNLFGKLEAAERV